jgi:hypothetical protein
MKALILASNKIQFIHFIRNFELNANDFMFVTGRHGYGEVYGYHWNTPVIMIEDYQYNLNYDLNLLTFIGHRFDNIGFLSTGEIYNGN